MTARFFTGLLFALAMFSISSSYAQSVYDVPFKDIDGNNINLHNYEGKKLVFIILPVQSDSLLVSIKDFAARLDSSVQLIGILSEDDGYTSAKKSLVKDLYHDTGLVLSEGMKTRKGGAPSLLAQWLTDRNKNLHFDADVQGAGHKFFIDRKGVLHAVLGPKVSLTAPVINRLLIQ